MRKLLVASSMFICLKLAASVPAIADPPEGEDPLCSELLICGPGANGYGRDFDSKGIAVHTPNGNIQINPGSPPCKPNQEVCEAE
jgi:hypothetical protein